MYIKVHKKGHRTLGKKPQQTDMFCFNFGLEYDLSKCQAFSYTIQDMTEDCNCNQ